MITPVITHAMRSQSVDPTWRAMSEETMKIPDPIIEPATSIVASVRVIATTNSPLRADGLSPRGGATVEAVLLIRS
ncbi:MAG: hypothetical protein NVS4B3_22640 [Gemmatimonadaceae bacterium]